MAGRGSAPGERRGGRRKGTPNKPTFNLDAVCPTDDLTPLGFALGVLNSKSKKVSDKDRKWAAKTAMPFCHPKIRPALAAAATGNVTVEIVHFTDAQVQAAHPTHEQQLAELDALGRQGDDPAPQAQLENNAIDRLEAEWFKPDNQRGAHKPPPSPIPAPTPPPPAPALREAVAADRAHGNGAHGPQPGNGADHPERVNGASQAPPGNGANRPQRGNGTVVHRSHDELRNIRARPREIRDYPPTHPVHGIV